MILRLGMLYTATACGKLKFDYLNSTRPWGFVLEFFLCSFFWVCLFIVWGFFLLLLFILFFLSLVHVGLVMTLRKTYETGIW